MFAERKQTQQLCKWRGRYYRMDNASDGCVVSRSGTEASCKVSVCAAVFTVISELLHCKHELGLRLKSSLLHRLVLGGKQSSSTFSASDTVDLREKKHMNFRSNKPL